VSVSIMHKAFEGCKAVERYAGGHVYKAVGEEEAVRANDAATGPDAAPGPEAVPRAETAMFRRRSLQPSRRAVLHVQAAGDPAVPSDVADWFTERAFHFYLAGLRVPHRVTARPGARSLAAACADLDAACARLRQADGIGSVIVAAQGRGALAAALWSASWSGSEKRAGGDAKRAGGEGRAGGDERSTDCRADALVLYEPELPARPALKLSISCPVLVVTGLGPADRRRAPGGAASRWPLLPRRAAPVAAQLGSHVTWLHLPRAAGQPGQADGAGRRLFFDELGRWLGAYMYGQARDQLL